MVSPRTRSSYDKQPTVIVPGAHEVWRGAAAWRHVAGQAEASETGAPVIVVDTYPGVDLPELLASIRTALPGFDVVDVEVAAAKSIKEIDEILKWNLTDDRVFGVMSHVVLAELYDYCSLETLADAARSGARPTVLVGWGAALVPLAGTTIVLADMARWEIQLRQRKGAPNWRCTNADEDNLRKVKRGFFVEWRLADRHKRALFGTMHFVLDTNASTAEGKLITAEASRAGMQAVVGAPFRVVPFFDPGVWGGQWMKDVLDLPDAKNYAWCFDCVPEENSVLLRFGDDIIELPSIDIVFMHPRELLGERTFARFGAEFPIRFDFLDTMKGGNLSLQVHPLTDYSQNTFGMQYTQDESYYLLEATDDAVVYLGLKTGTDPNAMITSLQAAMLPGVDFPVEEFVNAFPAKKHDHFLIPAGTVHCSGADTMVLEISATPYLFTFKMWDWGRNGLDGVPRPIHLEHARQNIQWDRNTEWTRDNLVSRVETVAEGDGWIEERTGLHELEFIEVRRHWFTGSVGHDTRGTVNVLNFVEGVEAIVDSPSGAFSPFVVHYAETFIVPAKLGAYRISPHGDAVGTRLGTVKASVRGTEREQP